MLWLLWLLFCLLPLGGSSSIAAQEGSHKAKLDNADPGASVAPAASSPQIYYCRSPNMEDFTCWWHPVDNLTSGQQAAYVLTYSKDRGPELECPDYTSGGSHSCYFDKKHTSIWKYYCMTVTAMTPHRNYTSQQHCLDVAEIGTNSLLSLGSVYFLDQRQVILEPEAPVNLSFSLRDAGGDEAGHSALLSWTYPAPEDLRYGWITLLYELQYRRIGEADKWKVKHPLREPHVELLGLRPDDYVVRVRCRSHNSRLWSKWSAALLVSVPNRLAAGKVLVLVLVVGVGAVALLVIAFGVIPQSRRIKDYFLPPIPKPRIIGIDPLLLKKGNFDEINRHFGNFHGYRPPSYSVEVWDQVSADGIYLSTPRDGSIPPSVLDRDRGTPVAIQNLFPIQNPSPFIRSAPPYCAVPPEAFAALQNAPSPWQQPETVFVPGSHFSTMERLGVPDASVSAPDPARAPVQDFYTCVQLMRDSGEVHLVPCLPAPYCQDFLLPPDPDAAKREEEEKSKRLAEYQARKSATEDDGDDRSDAADPLLPVSPEDTS